ncbi:hypothetical protein FMM56_04085 [Campylobacter sp. LR264d]|uniref:hypothetical protein n=1 Tax=Campylobacter sp. LR264d TaxID=2593544 RepID=UPI00123A743E|nr:hypothetical protein [Campylobacter sp. LR264d]KAA6231346.1 hypothetical protein FMM56_04085 [Campylobacter sp. LR264d]
MKFFIIFCLLIFAQEIILSNNFSQKKVIKIDKSKDRLNIIELNQNMPTQKLDEQKGLLDTSSIREEEARKSARAKKDKNIDFGILIGVSSTFGYRLNELDIRPAILSKLFAKKIINSLRLYKANTQANGLYQTQKTLNSLQPSGYFSIVDVSPYLKQEKNKNKMYSKFTDYLIIIYLKDFYVLDTNYIFMQTLNAHALVNFKIVSLTTGKVLVAKNLELKLALDSTLSSRENLESIAAYMPASIAQVIQDDGINLRLE